MEDYERKVLTKTAYEHLVAAVGKMLEEGKKAGQEADGDRLPHPELFAGIQRNVQGF